MTSKIFLEFISSFKFNSEVKKAAPSLITLFTILENATSIENYSFFYRWQPSKSGLQRNGAIRFQTNDLTIDTI